MSFTRTIRRSPLATLGLLAALAGISSPVNFAAQNAAHAASTYMLRNFAGSADSAALHRDLLRGIRAASRLFRHAWLNQRQRRKFNRQRHAAGCKHAFA